MLGSNGKSNAVYALWGLSSRNNHQGSDRTPQPNTQSQPPPRTINALSPRPLTPCLCCRKGNRPDVRSGILAVTTYRPSLRHLCAGLPLPLSQTQIANALHKRALRPLAHRRTGRRCHQRLRATRPLMEREGLDLQALRPRDSLLDL